MLRVVISSCSSDRCRFGRCRLWWLRWISRLLGDGCFFGRWCWVRNVIRLIVSDRMVIVMMVIRVWGRCSVDVVLLRLQSVVSVVSIGSVQFRERLVNSVIWVILVVLMLCWEYSWQCMELLESSDRFIVLLMVKVLKLLVVRLCMGSVMLVKWLVDYLQLSRMMKLRVVVFRVLSSVGLGMLVMVLWRVLGLIFCSRWQQVISVRLNSSKVKIRLMGWWQVVI